MAEGIFPALSGAMTTLKRVEVLAHNIANQSTPGFNRYRIAIEQSRQSTNQDQMVFSQAAPIETDIRPGRMKATNNPLDISLTEGIFMKVKMGDETTGQDAYVRGATLTRRADGMLTTLEGFLVMGEDYPISLPDNGGEIVVSPDGSVEVNGRIIEKLDLVEFKDTKLLERGQGRIMYNPDNGTEEGLAGMKKTEERLPVMAGYIEESNFDLLRGITDLIAAHRSYETTVKAIETFSHINKRAARDISSRV